MKKFYRCLNCKKKFETEYGYYKYENRKGGYIYPSYIECKSCELKRLIKDLFLDIYYKTKKILCVMVSKRGLRF